MAGADVCIGLSVKGAFTPAMIGAMAAQPIIFAMANPDPEITPEEIAKVRDDAIVATARSDYPNQITNVLGFPYIFPAALALRASPLHLTINTATAEAPAPPAPAPVPAPLAPPSDPPPSPPPNIA